MKTLYIDIYFLINFVIDIVAVHFSAIFTKTKSSNPRLLISAVIGAACACIVIFIKATIPNLLISIVALIIMIFICTPKINIKRRIAFGFALLIFISVVSGVVSWIWGILTESFSDFFIKEDFVNRKLLFFAIIVLLSIGVCKMMITLLSGGKIEAKIETTITAFGRSCTTDAFVDTGNLVIDPLGMKPVLIIKEKLAKQFLSDQIINLNNIDALGKDMKKKIRLIPISKSGATHVYVGLVPDSVTINYNGKIENIDVTIAIDKEGGDFGGCLALMPFSAVKNVLN